MNNSSGRKRNRDINYARIARALGIHENYFAVMKTSQQPKYRYMTSLDKDLIKAYRLYQKESSMVMEEAIANYYWLEDNRLISEFSKYLYEKGLYRNHNSFSTSASKVLFKIGGQFACHNSFISYKIINKLFKEKYARIKNTDTDN